MNSSINSKSAGLQRTSKALPSCCLVTVDCGTVHNIIMEL